MLGHFESLMSCARQQPGLEERGSWAEMEEGHGQESMAAASRDSAMEWEEGRRD